VAPTLNLFFLLSINNECVQWAGTG